jgi:hypothetical protein
LNLRSSAAGQLSAVIEQRVNSAPEQISFARTRNYTEPKQFASTTTPNYHPALKAARESAHHRAADAITFSVN